MSDRRPPHNATTEASITFYHADADAWEKALIEKVRQLRGFDKRVILLVDGSRIFVYSAEPRGTIALD